MGLVQEGLTKIPPRRVRLLTLLADQVKKARGNGIFIQYAVQKNLEKLKITKTSSYLINNKAS